MSAEASACASFRRAAANQGEPPKYERCVCGRLARDHGPTWDDLHAARAEEDAAHAEEYAAAARAARASAKANRIMSDLIGDPAASGSMRGHSFRDAERAEFYDGLAATHREMAAESRARSAA